MTDPAPTYRPASPDLLRTVADFLTELGPRLEPADRYTALVCNHILQMLQREMQAPPLPRLDEAALAAEIRAGVHDAHWDETLATLLERAAARVVIVKPGHARNEEGRKEVVLF